MCVGINDLDPLAAGSAHQLETGGRERAVNARKGEHTKVASDEEIRAWMLDYLENNVALVKWLALKAAEQFPRHDPVWLYYQASHVVGSINFEVAE